MIGPTQIKKPENWQDFEKLCKKLWGEIWNCSDTIQRNGRAGQSQNGVDVYGLPKGETAYYGIQCKGKDDYTKSQLTKDEIDREIGNALNFKPNLKRFIFATTANKDAKIEEYIREKNIESISQGKFEIYLSSWEDIVDLLEERRDTYNWYMNNCQYKNASDVEVLINGENEYTIHPQYIKKFKIYMMKENKILCNLSVERALINGYSIANLILPKSIKEGQAILPISFNKSKIDCRWCEIPITIINIGNTVIEDFIVYLYFDLDSIAGIDDGCHYNNYINKNFYTLINENKKIENPKREIFQSNEYNNVIEIRPKHPLVQTDRHTFYIKVKPKDEVKEITVSWELKSRNYNKEGSLKLIVDPIYDNKREIEIVEDESLLKETEIKIEPKIIEE